MFTDILRKRKHVKEDRISGDDVVMLVEHFDGNQSNAQQDVLITCAVHSSNDSALLLFQ